MRRLQNLLTGRNRKEDFSKATEEILSLVLNNRLAEANQAMNRIFEQLE